MLARRLRSSIGPTLGLSVVLALLATTDRACGLGTEQAGNKPIAPGLGLTEDVLNAVNLPGRVLWREVNGDPWFYFHGDTAALNEALKKFAAIKADGHEIIVLPGPGGVKSWEGQSFASDWQVHVPSGLYYAIAKNKKDPDAFSTRATLTIYLNVERPKLPDEKLVKQLLLDLDSDTFAVREKAGQELEKLGRSVRPLLRKTLEAKPSEEVRSRIAKLLEKLEGIDLDELKVPAGLPVVDVTDLSERCRKGLQSADPEARGTSAGALARLALSGEDVVPTLIEVLKKDKHEYVRRCVASGLANLGKRAEPALPTLRDGLKDADVNIRNCFETSIRMIEEATDEPPKDEAKRLRAIRDDIRQFRKTLPGKSEK